MRPGGAIPPDRRVAGAKSSPAGRGGSRHNHLFQVLANLALGPARTGGRITLG
jgi:hypothetical protein